MSAESPIELQDLEQSRVYVREMLISERRRVLWLVVAVAVIMAFAVVRNIAFFWGQRLGIASLGIAVAFVLFELGQLRLITAALRGGRRSVRWLWAGTAVCEALLPTAVLWAIIALPGIGPQRALAYPAVCLYFVVLLLLTLRLQPWLCLLAGGVCVAGYLATAARALALAAQAGESAESLHWSIYATFALMIAVAAAAAAGVAGQLRARLLAALREADARRRSELHSRDTLIFALAKLAECRDTDTGTHLERIAEYAAVLARALPRAQCPEAWIEQLRVASSLHDIGKVGLPDDVLRKPGPLSPEERATMQRHPTIGAEALRAIIARQGDDTLLGMGEQIAAAHHEKWDGSGYPGGLAGAAIPLAARIVAIVDVYDALTTTRVYKPPMSHAQACDIIRAGRGSHFDPHLVDLFLARGGQFDAIRARHFAEHTAPAGACEPRG